MEQKKKIQKDPWDVDFTPTWKCVTPILQDEERKKKEGEKKNQKRENRQEIPDKPFIMDVKCGEMTYSVRVTPEDMRELEQENEKRREQGLTPITIYEKFRKELMQEDSQE